MRTEDEIGKFKVEIESLQDLDKKKSENMDLLCEKFEPLALLVSKEKPGGAEKGVSRQDIIVTSEKGQYITPGSVSYQRNQFRIVHTAVSMGTRLTHVTRSRTMRPGRRHWTRRRSRSRY